MLCARLRNGCREMRVGDGATSALPSLSPKLSESESASPCLDSRSSVWTAGCLRLAPRHPEPLCAWHVIRPLPPFAQGVLFAVVLRRDLHRLWIRLSTSSDCLFPRTRLLALEGFDQVLLPIHNPPPNQDSSGYWLWWLARRWQYIP